MGITKARVEQRENGTSVMGWQLDSNNPFVKEARQLGIDVEGLVGKAEHNPSGAGWALTLKAEIEAVKQAREVKDWRSVKQTQRKFHVRAIKAEKQRNDMQHEAAMLKERLKQADNGAGDWVEEREALLAQIASLEAKLAEPREDVLPRIKELQEQNARQAESIQGLQEQLQEAQQAHSYDSELIQQPEAKIKGWEEAFKDSTAAYEALKKECNGKVMEREYYRIELEGYKSANHKLKEANEHLQEQLDFADQREALPDEVQWLRSQVSVLIEKLR